MTIDKILHNVPKRIIETIDECANMQDIKKIRQWLKDCNSEIQRRIIQHEDMSFLYYERSYLEIKLGGYINDIH
jgi:hypothetical protein